MRRERTKASAPQVDKAFIEQKAFIEALSKDNFKEKLADERFMEVFQQAARSTYFKDNLDFLIEANKLINLDSNDNNFKNELNLLQQNYLTNDSVNINAELRKTTLEVIENQTSPDDVKAQIEKAALDVWKFLREDLLATKKDKLMEIIGMAQKIPDDLSKINVEYIQNMQLNGKPLNESNKQIFFELITERILANNNQTIDPKNFRDQVEFLASQLDNPEKKKNFLFNVIDMASQRQNYKIAMPIFDLALDHGCSTDKYFAAKMENVANVEGIKPHLVNYLNSFIKRMDETMSYAKYENYDNRDNVKGKDDVAISNSKDLIKKIKDIDSEKKAQWDVSKYVKKIQNLKQAYHHLTLSENKISVNKTSENKITANKTSENKTQAQTISGRFGWIQNKFIKSLEEAKNKVMGKEEKPPAKTKMKP